MCIEKKEPNNIDALKERAVLYANKGKYLLAEKDVDKLLDLES